MKDLEKATIQTAKQLTTEIETAFESCVKKFYSSYSPVWYRRTLSTYQASDHYGGKGKGYKKSGKRVQCGINIDSSRLGNPYRAETDWVFTRTFEKGIHGYTVSEARAWNKIGTNHFYTPAGLRKSNSPRVMMDKEYNRISGKDHVMSLWNANISAMLPG